MQKSKNPTYKNIYLLKRFIPYYKNHYPVLFLSLFCAALTTIGDLVLPILVRNITQKGLEDVKNLTTSFILTYSALYILIRIIDAAANFYMDSVAHVMGAKIETSMRRDLYSHLQNLSFSYYDNAKVGQIMARITTDLFEVTEFSHHCPENLFIAVVQTVVSFAVLGSINIWLTLIIFSVLPFMVYSAVYFNKKMRASFKKSKVQIGEINARVEDSLLGNRVVKSFSNEEIEEEKFRHSNERILKIKRTMYKHMASFYSSTRLFEGLMYILVVAVGAFFMRSGKITAADFTAFLLYVATLLSSIRILLQLSEQFQLGMAGIERFVEIMDAPIEIKDKEHAQNLKKVVGDIKFENVSFRYSDDLGNVLNNINLDVKAGENVALVGPSGGGKSTLCNLIPRFYEPTSGRILIDGKDIQGLTLKSLRSKIGMVQQDVYMFSGTVFDNIEYGKPKATREEVIAAAKMAGAHDFIMKLEHGYDTYVGERGVKLSGGQKQRISIARVFLKDPPILILDEATSALDNESERIVQESLEKLAVGRTTFTIAHRLTTIRNASVILVLTENGIEEQGTHEELLGKNGIYASLYTAYQKL